MAPQPPADSRPTAELPFLQLVRLSLYWLGLTCVFGGITPILNSRLEFDGIVRADQVGGALAQVSLVGGIVAMAMQPTIGTISDYTTSRWGRRKPYILIGSILDIAFLFGIASSNTVLSIAAFVVLLQFSSNLAQGPFQGYVPDLVPEQQVGSASALMGLFSALGNITGTAIAALATATHQYVLATLAVGVIEVVTMLSVVIHVDEGRAAKPRQGRSWTRVALEAWGTDILRERSFLFLLGSRLLVLTGGSLVVVLGTSYLRHAMGLSEKDTGVVMFAVLAAAMIGNLVALMPAARISDRIGRKPVIYVSCAAGGVALLTLALAPSVPIALVGAAIYGVSAGIFLAVDWALMTDIIPKASSGRYMGISNLATGSAGQFAVVVGGAIIMDNVNRAFGMGTGARAAMLFGVACYVVGAVVLAPVVERRREGAGPVGGSDSATQVRPPAPLPTA